MTKKYSTAMCLYGTRINVFKDLFWFSDNLRVFRGLKVLQTASNVYSADSGRFLPISVKGFYSACRLSSCKKNIPGLVSLSSCFLLKKGRLGLSACKLVRSALFNQWGKRPMFWLPHNIYYKHPATRKQRALIKEYIYSAINKVKGRLPKKVWSFTKPPSDEKYKIYVFFGHFRPFFTLFRPQIRSLVFYYPPRPSRPTVL